MYVVLVFPSARIRITRGTARELFLVVALLAGGCESGDPRPEGQAPAGPRQPNAAAASHPGETARIAQAPDERDAEPSLCERYATEGRNVSRQLAAPLQSIRGERLQRVQSFAETWGVEHPDVARRLSAAAESPGDMAAFLSALSAEAPGDAGVDLDAALESLSIDRLARADEPSASGQVELRTTLAAVERRLESRPSIWLARAVLVPEEGQRRALLELAVSKGLDTDAARGALARMRLRSGDDAGTDIASASVAHERAAMSPPLLGEWVGVRVHARSLPRSSAEAIARSLAAQLDEARHMVGIAGADEVRLAAPRAPIVVHVHHDLEALQRGACAPAWASAAFDGRLHITEDLASRHLEGDAAATRSLRHEIFHAALSSRTPLAPRWLQEGAAQRFAGEPPAAESDPQLPLASVESSLAASGGHEAGAAYLDARRWVDRLVRSGGDQAIANAIQLIRDGTPRGGLEALLFAPGSAP